MDTSLSSDIRVDAPHPPGSGTRNTVDRYGSSQTDRPVGAVTASGTEVGRHKSLGFAQIVLGICFYNMLDSINSATCVNGREVQNAVVDRSV
eukprot:g27015.t1